MEEGSLSLSTVPQKCNSESMRRTSLGEESKSILKEKIYLFYIRNIAKNIQLIT